MFTGEGFSLHLGFRNFFVFTDDWFSLISGFTEILCLPENPLYQRMSKHQEVGSIPVTKLREKKLWFYGTLVVPYTGPCPCPCPCPCGSYEQLVSIVANQINKKVNDWKLIFSRSKQQETTIFGRNIKLYFIPQVPW